ncbi:MAG: phospho-N-acetylmuramoyl-pentapeptide-transferase, partial [bacterium]
MLYSILYSLHNYISCFNIFRYITFRAMLVALTSLLITLFIGKPLIKWLKQFQIKQVINENAPSSHKTKCDTPTMGGLLIIFGVFFSTLCWANLSNRYIWVCLFSLLWLGGLGFIDDYLKLKNKNSKGLIVRYKLIGQCILGIIIALYFFYYPPNIAFLSGQTVLDSNYHSFLTHNYTTKIVIPFMKNMFIDLGIFYFLFIILVVIASS